MSNDFGDWEDALNGDVSDGAIPSLEWDQMDDLPALPGLEDMSLLDEEPMPDDLRVTEHGALPWGPGASEGYVPWAQAATDSPPMGDQADTPEYGAPLVPAQNAHPGVDPDTLYDRDSYEEPIDERATIGQGIFDLPDQGAVFREGDGMFAHDYALPAYIAREPDMDVYETEALDTNTGLPRVAQVNASGVQLQRSDPERVWSPFAPPPYGGTNPMNVQPGVRKTLHNYGNAIPSFGAAGARALMNAAAQRCPHDANQRGTYICRMIDAMVPNLSPRALAAVAQLRGANYPGNPVELVVGHVLMYVAVCDLTDKVKNGDGSPRLPRLDKLQSAGAMTPELARCAQQHLGPVVSPPAAARAVAEFKKTKDGQTTRSMLGDTPNDLPSNPPTESSPGANGEPGFLRRAAPWALGATLGAVGLYFGAQWWQERQKKGRKKK